MAPPTTFGVTAEREVYIVREAVPGTIPASLGSPMPLTAFTPSSKPTWINDESFQGSMGDVYGVYQGPLIAGWTMGANLFGDVFGGLLWNLMGDYTVTGTAASPASTTSAPVIAGATALPVASGGASFTAGMQVWIEDSGTPAANEVVTVGAGSTSTSVVLSTPTRFAHSSATPFTNSTAPYTHVFSSLNGSVGAVNGPAQGPTHCITDRTGLGTNAADVFAYSCLSQIVITGNADGLMKWTAQAVCASQVPASAPVGTVGVSNVATYPGWRSVTGISGVASGGTQVKNVEEWSVTLTRQVKAFNTDQGSQQPYIIARGKQGVSGKNTFLPAIDESPLTQMLGNTQPQMQYVAANGLSGASAVSLQLDVALGAYKTADVQDGDILFGYDAPWDGVHTAVTGLTGPPAGTMTGASGGKGAAKITLVNAVPTY